jgi:putative membrane protein
MDYMFEPGFLGTRAPFFMDFVTIMVVLLPLLVLGAIAMAKVKAYKLHALTQGIIFIIAVIVVGYFEYGVRLAGGFDAFMEGSHTSHNYALIVLVFHIAIALIGLVVWIKTFISARKATKKNQLPGSSSKAHQKAGKITFVAIFLTAFTGLWVYVILFIY